MRAKKKRKTNFTPPSPFFVLHHQKTTPLHSYYERKIIMNNKRLYGRQTLMGLLIPIFSTTR